MRQFSHFFSVIILKSARGREWVVRVLVVFTDPFYERAKHKMVGHPTRNAFGSCITTDDSGHEELSSGFPCKLNKSGALNTN